LISPTASANLLSTNELTAAGVSVKFSRDQAGDRIPCTLTILHREGRKIKFSLTQHNGIWPVPSRRHCNGYAKISGRDMNTLIKAYHTIHGTSPPDEHSFHTRMLTEAELWHLRLGHAHISKIAKLSKNCIGIVRPIAEARHPCHDCQDSNVIKNNAPPPSENHVKGVWNIDLVDMGIFQGWMHSQGSSLRLCQ
jgi:hypothetical protein